jgi:hypothetical protein
VPIFDASPEEFREALLGVRARVSALDEPRRWYTALVMAVMVRAGELAEWRDWRVEPPAASEISMTPATMRAIQGLFSTPTSALLRQTQVGGVVQHIGSPAKIIVDPFRQQGHGAGTSASICVVTPERRRFDIPVDDAGWLWNADTPVAWGPPNLTFRTSGESFP